MYTIVHSYSGTVESGSTGVAMVTGRMDLIPPDDAASWERSSAASIADQDRLANIGTPAIGYFVVDVNINAPDNLPQQMPPGAQRWVAPALAGDPGLVTGAPAGGKGFGG